MESEPKTGNKNELPPAEEQAVLGVNEYLQKEADRTGEKFPPVFIKFFSGAHDTEDDAVGISKELENSDIYVPEMIRWTEEQAKEINDISFRKIPPDGSDRMITAHFYQPILKALASSGKPVVFIDLPREEVLKWEEEEDNPFWDKRKYLDSLEYEDAVQETRERVKHEADWQMYREDYMRSALGPKIAETLRAYPNLCAKEKITALITLGVFHTDIYHKLKKRENTAVARSFSKTTVFDPDNEAVRRYMFEKRVSDDLLRNVLTQEVLARGGCYKKFLRVTEDSFKQLKVARMLVKLFEGERKEVFERWRENKEEEWGVFMKERGVEIGQWDEFRDEFEKWREEKELDTQGFQRYFDAKLLEKGIKIPENEKELDELLARKYGKKTTKEA